MKTNKKECEHLKGSYDHAFRHQGLSGALIYPLSILCEGAMSAVRILAATLLTACPRLWFILYTEHLLVKIIMVR